MCTCLLWEKKTCWYPAISFLSGWMQYKYKCSLFRVILLIMPNMCSRQIYVEIERARLTKTLANIKEQSGDVKEAASILQELQVRERCYQIVSLKISAHF